MFIFGDSLVDPGNNNNLITLLKANYYPNGIDFPAGVTGRFCNGATVTDHLGHLLGLPLISRFTDIILDGPKILKGINYASAGGGIRPTTSKQYGYVYSMDDQIKNHQNSIALLELQLKINKGGKVQNFFAKSLFARLYDLGGRKFLVAGLGPLGCLPNQIGSFSNDTNKCVERTNEMVMQYNTKLKNLIGELNTNLTGAYFLYWDVYNPTMEIIDNPAHYGFKYSHKACCGAGRAKGQIICLPLLWAECQDRSKFVFWDAFHTTDAFNAIAAKQAYQGKLQSTYPTNVKDLIQL
ncbi:hypothetical protein ACLOJK_012063 [Asimina triloba]